MAIVSTLSLDFCDDNTVDIYLNNYNDDIRISNYKEYLKDFNIEFARTSRYQPDKTWADQIFIANMPNAEFEKFYNFMNDEVGYMWATTAADELIWAKYFSPLKLHKEIAETLFDKQTKELDAVYQKFLKYMSNYKNASEYEKLVKLRDFVYEDYYVLSPYSQEDRDYMRKNSLYGQSPYEALVLKKSLCAGHAKACCMLGKLAGLDCDFGYNTENSGCSHAWAEFYIDGETYILTNGDRIDINTYKQFFNKEGEPEHTTHKKDPRGELK